METFPSRVSRIVESGERERVGQIPKWERTPV